MSELLVSEAGLEPAQPVKATGTSSQRVCQFRHPDECIAMLD